MEEEIIKNAKKQNARKKDFTAQKSVLINADNLYKKEIDAFRSKKILPANPKVDTSDKSEYLKSESSFEESVPERTKLRRQKNIMKKLRSTMIKNTYTRSNAW